jgi:hypothetical protein
MNLSSITPFFFQALAQEISHLMLLNYAYFTLFGYVKIHFYTLDHCYNYGKEKFNSMTVFPLRHIFYVTVCRALLSLTLPSSLRKENKSFQMKEDARKEIGTLNNRLNWNILYTVIIYWFFQLLGLVILEGIMIFGVFV